MSVLMLHVFQEQKVVPCSQHGVKKVHRAENTSTRFIATLAI